VIVLVILLASIPDRLDTLRSVKQTAQIRNSMADDLRALVPRLPACQPIHAYRTFVILPATLRYELGDWSPPKVDLDAPPARGVFISPRSRREALQLRLKSSDRPVTLTHLPGRVRQTQHWSWSAVGCPRRAG
jgi:hypothetical protein